MHVAQLSLLSSLATMPQALARSGDTDRTQQETASHDRQIESKDAAEAAAGIGTTHEEQAASDRDADGRRPWEIEIKAKEEPPPSIADDVKHVSQVATGQCGLQLDLSG
jgi:hypothetical protein